MTQQEERFLQSARRRASEKDMDVQMYLCKQIALSADALEQVRGQSSKESRESAAADFDIVEIQDASSRLKSHLEVEL
jgi:hypothetical protein